MSNLIVIGFNDESTAFAMRAELVKMQTVSNPSVPKTESMYKPGVWGHRSDGRLLFL